MLWLVPALPLLGSVLILFVGRAVGRLASGLIACAAVLGAFVIAALAVLVYVGGDVSRPIQLHLFPWIAWNTGQTETVVAEAGLLLDPLASVMVLVVTGVGLLIHVYSLGYMANDPDVPRFFTYLNLFTFSMLILVLANNFLLMFVGWELVGLCSYLLIGFWYTRPSAASAGKKAFIVNRVGDWGFLIGLFLIWTSFGTFQFFGDGGAGRGVLEDPGRVLSRAGAGLDVGAFLGADAGQTVLTVATAIPFLLFVGATGKSAQVPLYVWLPDAMEGPTPVSALIHAATMVTAGVYMVARMHSLYRLAPEVLTLVAVVGALTAILSASIGLVQTDIKRVLAYSTVSQLGYMFLGLGAGAFAAGIFHLMTHAFFKALLFLAAGSVIHALGDEQDLRRMGGLFGPLKVTAITFMVGGLAISGFPPFAGFFSKDLILAKTFARGLDDPIFLALYAIGLVTAVLTAFYMSRLVFLTFFGPYRGAEGGLAPATAAVVPEHEPAAATPAAAAPGAAPAGLARASASDGMDGTNGAFGGRGHAEAAAHGLHGGDPGRPHEAPPTMLVPLVALALLSLVGGVLFPLGGGFPPFMLGGAGETAFEQFLAPSVGEHAAAEAAGALVGELEWLLTAASVAAAAAGVLAAAAIYLARRPSASELAATFRIPYIWLRNKWYVDELYQALLAHPGARLASFFAAFDLGVLDGTVNGVARAARDTGRMLRRLQSGYVRGYAVTMLIGAFFVLAYWAFRQG